jgi:hypothetical protein
MRLGLKMKMPYKIIYLQPAQDCNIDILQDFFLPLSYKQKVLFSL